MKGHEDWKLNNETSQLKVFFFFFLMKVFFFAFVFLFFVFELKLLGEGKLGFMF